MSYNKNIYDRLGVKKLINAAGTYTIVGGSRMSKKTVEAMQSASENFVDIRVLQDKIHRRLAEITNNESAYVTNGAAAGLYLAAAACIFLKLNCPLNYISVEEVKKCEIIVFRAHRNPYDWSLRQLGITLKEVGYPNMIQPTSVNDLEQTITENTVAVFYTEMKEGWISAGALELKKTVAVADRYGIPVIVDGAAQLPPVENLWKFNDMGASATIFSGGKDLSGPQSSGLITGKKRLLDVVSKTGFPNYGIGRMLKVGREEMVGLMTAVEQYVSMDHKARKEWCEKQVLLLMDEFGDYEDIEVLRSYPNEAGQPIPQAIISCNHSDINSSQIIAYMKDGSPGIFTMPADKNSFFINPMTLTSGETEVIIERLKEIFTELKIS